MDGCVAKAWRRNVVKCFERLGRNVKDAIEWEWESFKQFAASSTSTMNLRDVDPSRARPSPSLDGLERAKSIDAAGDWANIRFILSEDVAKIPLPNI